MKTYTQAEALRIRNERIRRYGKSYIIQRIRHGHWIVRRHPVPNARADEYAAAVRRRFLARQRMEAA